MKSVSKVQFGQLNDKRFYFSNGIISLPYSHPYLENLRKEKHKLRDIHKVIPRKKDDFLKEESKIIENIPRLNILKQMFGQIPILHELNSNTKVISSGWKTTKELIKNGSCKMSSIYDGQFYGNILVVGRTGCGKTRFLEKLGLNKFFGNIINRMDYRHRH